MKNKKLIKIVLTSMFAALVAGFTFFPKIPIPGGGYVHLGDTMIYLAATFLPLPYAMVAAAVGGGLADVLSGYTAYAPFTIIVKTLLTVAFSNKNDKILAKRNRLAPLAGIVITPAIYFVADTVFYGAGAAVPGIIWNLVQATASMIVFYIIGAAFDKMLLKSKLGGKI